MTPSMPPNPAATPPPVTLRLQTDRSTYGRGDAVGLRVVIANAAQGRITISELSRNAPEWESSVLMTRPDGSTTACVKPENGELISISGMYPSVEAGAQIVEPSVGYRPLTKWGCGIDAVGTYTLRLRREFLDFSSGRFSYVLSSPTEIHVLESIRP